VRKQQEKVSDTSADAQTDEIPGCHGGEGMRERKSRPSIKGKRGNRWRAQKGGSRPKEGTLQEELQRTNEWGNLLKKKISRKSLK